MKIESIIRRKNGTVGTARDGTRYQFQPDSQGRHVAEITNEAHAAHFISIPEGYRFLKADDADTMPEGVRLLAGNVSDPEAVERAETELQIAKGVIDKLEGDLRDSRERIAALTSENTDLKRRIDLADTALDGEPVTAPAPVETKAPVVEAAADGKPEKSAHRLELEAAHKAKFGKLPHPRLSDEKVAAQNASKA